MSIAARYSASVRSQNRSGNKPRDACSVVSLQAPSSSGVSHELQDQHVYRYDFHLVCGSRGTNYTRKSNSTETQCGRGMCLDWNSRAADLRSKRTHRVWLTASFRSSTLPSSPPPPRLPTRSFGQPGHDISLMHWFRDDIVRPGSEILVLILPQGITRTPDNINVRTGCADFTRYFHSRHLRHLTKDQ